MQWIVLVIAAGVVNAVSSAQDTPRRHTETATAPHEYTIQMGGTLDGRNTRDPIVYAAWKQGFEPMRSVRLENLGDTDVVNPWVLVNGKRNWRTAKEIADEAVRSYGDPAKLTDAEKARAIWDFQRRHRFHATTGDLEVRDPVKLYNVYGYALCGDNAPALADLWRLAGFRTRRGYPIGHCVSEVWYQGAWHMLDADESVLFLERDNQTIASEGSVAHDHELAKRSYPGKMLEAMYSYDAPHSGDYPSHTGHTMHMTLRPGEALEWRWDHAGKYHHAAEPALYLVHTDLKGWGGDAWAALSNGRWIYSPPLGKAAGRTAVQSSEPARLTWKIETPYVIVGGKVKARVRGGPGSVYIFRVSRNQHDWTEAFRIEGAPEAGIDRSLDQCFPNAGPAVYGYFLQVEFRGGPDGPVTGIDAITIENDLQMARLSLPALELGENRIRYVDESHGSRAVRVTFDWVERSAVAHPDAPADPRYPADGATVEGTRFTLRWRDAKAVANYHLQLSDDPQVRYALSPAFDVTVAAAKPEFAIPSDGLLNPGRRYYWHVRAKSVAGVWGPWSRTWSFVPQGPGSPLLLTLDQTDPEAFALRWETNQTGRKPARFKIYASDEKGFTASDEAYAAATGNQKTRGLFPGQSSRTFPGNLLATTTEAAFRLRPRHAFYRVVAIDGKGNRSGASGYAAAPRPFIYSEPEPKAKAGSLYRYEVKTIASIGDLTYRDFGPDESYQSAYWDWDRPKFSLDVEMPRCGNFDPKWLKIDQDTGLLSGTPAIKDAGEYLINVRVEIAGAGIYLQSFPLLVSE